MHSPKVIRHRLAPSAHCACSLPLKFLSSRNYADLFAIYHSFLKYKKNALGSFIGQAISKRNHCSHLTNQFDRRRSAYATHTLPSPVSILPHCAPSYPAQHPPSQATTSISMQPSVESGGATSATTISMLPPTGNDAQQR